MLKSSKKLSLEKDSQPNYVRFELETDDEEFRFPPATHFIATVDDLTNMLDTSILHHAFISIFIAVWAVISHYVTILMAILSYFTRFT